MSPRTVRSSAAVTVVAGQLDGAVVHEGEYEEAEATHAQLGGAGEPPHGTREGDDRHQYCHDGGHEASDPLGGGRALYDAVLYVIVNNDE